MKKEFQFIGALLILIIFQTNAQNPKAKTGTFALTHATIETITRGIITDGTIILSKGKIEAMGNQVTVPANAEVIDCSGLRVYPGMIDGGTKLGLLEIGQIPQASDEAESGEVNPHMKALTAINPNSAIIPVTRLGGVTTVITAPEGRLIPGTAALVNLFGYTPDQMYAGFECVLINFPQTGRRAFFDRRTDEEISKAAEKQLKLLNEVWDKAVEYHKVDSAGLKYYPEMQAMLPSVSGRQPAMIEVNTQKDILAALKWVKEKKIKKVIFSGVAEGWRVAAEIAKANIPVITGPVISLPTREYDRYDQAYANAGAMKKAGVKVAIRSQEDGNGNYRNLPFHAGFAAAYGMDKDDALKAITIIPAEIFGVSDKLGSLEVGKNATLFICNGDPFETKTVISQVFIDGWKIPMVSRQTQLYDEFLKREPGVNKN